MPDIVAAFAVPVPHLVYLEDRKVSVYGSVEAANHGGSEAQEEQAYIRCCVAIVVYQKHSTLVVGAPLTPSAADDLDEHVVNREIVLPALTARSAGSSLTLPAAVAVALRGIAPQEFAPSAYALQAAVAVALAPFVAAAA